MPPKTNNTAAIYARVSTRNGQTTENQLRELRAVARRHGWKIVATYTDDGISGAKGLDTLTHRVGVRHGQGFSLCPLVVPPIAFHRSHMKSFF